MPDITTTVANASHIPKFGGKLWFVSKGSGSDSNDGTMPDKAFETISKAITECSAGDAITIMAGIYTETGLDLNKDNTELWFEIGVEIDPGSGTALTVSGNYCKVNKERDYLTITPASGQVGVEVTGENCVFNNVKAKGTTIGNGWNLAGKNAYLFSCKASGVGAGNKAFNITKQGCKLLNCRTDGGTTSYGYYLDGTGTPFADGILDGCTSIGHRSGGFYLTSGVSNITLLRCSSGAKDGKWRDIDDASVWSDFTYDNIIYKLMTLDGSTAYNLFKVTGAIELFNIFGHVTTEIADTNSDMNLELYSANGSVDITANTNPNIQADVVGTVYAKVSATDEPLSKGEPDNTPAVVEGTEIRSPKVPIILVEDDGADTYVQAVLSAGVASGAIHWHVEYTPITDSGIIEAVD